DEKIRFYFYLNLGSLILYVFCSFIPEVSRIGYYLNVTNIFLIPSVLKSIPDKRQRWFFSGAVAAAFCLYFAMFLRDAYAEGIRLLPYQSWLFH
ncbi:MAG: EpsG family protein, partial [Lachnospiraceae bacterium]|nr:EpsG family protein [Lachnospiraceae bacterium]